MNYSEFLRARSFCRVIRNATAFSKRATSGIGQSISSGRIPKHRFGNGFAVGHALSGHRQTWGLTIAVSHCRN
jgi:hypothetical protein